MEHSHRLVVVTPEGSAFDGRAPGVWELFSRPGEDGGPREYYVVRSRSFAVYFSKGRAEYETHLQAERVRD
jgi:hypothetical protein